MNRYEIYQVKEEFLREYGFASMRELLWTHHAEAEGEDPSPEAQDDRRAAQGDSVFLLPADVWALVYTYRTEKEPSLDWIYSKFNRGVGKDLFPGQREDMETPADFHGHSLSVSDIIKTPDGRLWFCDSFGWKEVKWAS